MRARLAVHLNEVRSDRRRGHAIVLELGMLMVSNRGIVVPRPLTDNHLGGSVATRPARSLQQKREPVHRDVSSSGHPKAGPSNLPCDYHDISD